MAQSSGRKQRPLSPHLQVYKPQLTSILSITHRATGVYLASAVLGIISWIYGLASGPECFYAVTGFWNSGLGKLIVFSWLVCFYYHLANGIRHLLWDMGWGYELPKAYKTGYLVLAVTGGLSLLTALMLF